MIEAIIKTIWIMGWLGIILGILSLVNIITGTLVNIWQKKEKFNWKKLFKGIGKVIAFYLSVICVGVAFTMLPFINDMITEAFNTVLLSTELLNTFSSVGVLSITISTITIQAKKAIEGIIALSNLSSDTEIQEDSEQSI